MPYNAFMCLLNTLNKEKRTLYNFCSKSSFFSAAEVTQRLLQVARATANEPMYGWSEFNVNL